MNTVPNQNGIKTLTYEKVANNFILRPMFLKCFLNACGKREFKEAFGTEMFKTDIYITPYEADALNHEHPNTPILGGWYRTLFSKSYILKFIEKWQSQ